MCAHFADEEFGKVERKKRKEKKIMERNGHKSDQKKNEKKIEQQAILARSTHHQEMR